VSPPNVLAPFRADNTLEFGTTTVTFQVGTRIAGLYLVIGGGSNVTTTWTTIVTVTDVKHNSVSATVTCASGVRKTVDGWFQVPIRPGTQFDVVQTNMRFDSGRGIGRANGSVFPDFTPVFALSLSDPAVTQSARHIFDAQNVPSPAG
jgi:hypothetical protein